LKNRIKLIKNQSKELSDAQLLRYSRHVLLDALGIEGQTKIRSATALIVGVGGLGCPAAQYLASAGIGRLIIIDHDTIDTTNLQRQVLHSAERVGMLKVESAKQAIAAINPEVEVMAVAKQADIQELLHWAEQSDVVLDCCDNFPTRYAVNQACVQLRKPLISGAAVKFEGQLAVFDLREPTSPCYHCVFPDGQSHEETRCGTMGVFAPLTGIIGTLQAAEALKLIAQCGESLAGKLQLFNALTGQWRTVRTVRDDGCALH
jgi:adenylyltransferase/sulfurtransferase